MQLYLDFRPRSVKTTWSKTRFYCLDCFELHGSFPNLKTSNSHSDVRRMEGCSTALYSSHLNKKTLSKTFVWERGSTSSPSSPVVLASEPQSLWSPLLHKHKRIYGCRSCGGSWLSSSGTKLYFAYRKRFHDTHEHLSLFYVYLCSDLRT